MLPLLIDVFNGFVSIGFLFKAFFFLIIFFDEPLGVIELFSNFSVKFFFEGGISGVLSL